jgi:hypothetical protein
MLAVIWMPLWPRILETARRGTPYVREEAGAVVAELVEGFGGQVGLGAEAMEEEVEVAGLEDGADLADEDVAGDAAA